MVKTKLSQTCIQAKINFKLGHQHRINTLKDKNSVVYFLFILFSQSSDTEHVNMIYDTKIIVIQEFNFQTYEIL
jgi:hypothetical protein